MLTLGLAAITAAIELSVMTTERANHQPTVSTGHPLPDALAAPARRALAAAGITRLEQLASVSEADLLRLHGMGPRALDVLRSELTRRGLSFG